TLLLMAHYALAETLCLSGEFLAARPHWESSLALYDTDRHATLALLHGGYDPGMFCRIVAGWTLWYLGYPDQALQQSRQALAWAQQLADPNSMTLALCHVALMHHLRRETQSAGELAESALSIANTHGLSFMVSFAMPLKGWAMVEHGDRE